MHDRRHEQSTTRRRVPINRAAGLLGLIMLATAADALAAPDLVPTGVTAPASATTQQALTASWTVQNQGANDATGSWRDHLWLSSDAVLGGDTNLGFVDHGGLTAGSSYTSTLPTTVPNVPAG